MRLRPQCTTFWRTSLPRSYKCRFRLSITLDLAHMKDNTQYTRPEVQYDNDVLDNSTDTENIFSKSRTTKMARTRKQRAAPKATCEARPSIRTPAQKATSTRCMLLEIPLELRDMIYGYVLGTIRGYSRFSPSDAEKTQERLHLINKLERLKAEYQRRRTRSSRERYGEIRSLEGQLEKLQRPLHLGLLSANKQLFEEVHDHIYRHVTIDIKLRTASCFTARKWASCDQLGGSV